MGKSSIEWTEETWNPLTGCTKISPGCKNCYAERMAKRLKAMGNPNYENGFDLTVHHHVLRLPLTWKRPRTVFVNSMSDLFHESVPAQYIHDVFGIMEAAERHTFQVLTKRAERLQNLSMDLHWPKNVWMGVSIETDEYVSRADCLRETGAAVKFLSLEPLLGLLPSLNLTGIHWTIVGGESGPKARAMDPAWVLNLRDRCRSQKVPFFFKQWGGKNKKATGRLLQGRLWDEMPARL